MSAHPLAARRLLSLLTVATLTASGVIVGLVTAPAAAADVSPVTQPTANTVKVDALPTVQIDGVVWDAGSSGTPSTPAASSARPAGRRGPWHESDGAQQPAGVRHHHRRADDVVRAQSQQPGEGRRGVSPDGSRVYVGGSFTQANGVARNRIAAFNTATGQLITSFNAGVDYTVERDRRHRHDGLRRRRRSTAPTATRGNRLAAFNAPTAPCSAGPRTRTPRSMRSSSRPTSPASSPAARSPRSTVRTAYGLGRARRDDRCADTAWQGTDKIRNAGASSAILSLRDRRPTRSTARATTSGAGGNLEGTFAADPTTGASSGSRTATATPTTAGRAATASSTPSATPTTAATSAASRSPTRGRSTCATRRPSPTNATGTLGHDPHGYYDWFGTPSPSMINWFPEFQAGTFTGQDQAAWTVTGTDDYVVIGGEFLERQRRRAAGSRAVRPSPRSRRTLTRAPKLDGGAVRPEPGAAFPPARSGSAWPANWDQDDQQLTYRLIRNNNTAAPDLHDGRQATPSGTDRRWASSTPA